jgi:transcriptional regulator with XRE-family HTH domain
MSTKSWRRIREERSKLSLEQRAKIDEAVLADVLKMRLGELRKAQHMTQETIAEVSGMAQADISKLERRTDMYVSTLRRYVTALGGDLRITVQFRDGSEVEIDGLTSNASATPFYEEIGRRARDAESPRAR